ncbi:MAG: FAD-binding protein [Comamonadaceae bacterium]|nr:MAG: FAD-binding protein [Comamonadaceae bacterium]
MKFAIVGAGWAGLAAAVAATQAGHAVTVFEAARTLGGRARALPVTRADGSTVVLDNGQHILIGAYSETLRLMQRVGVDPDAALLRLPLALVFPDGQGLRLPKLPAPFDALVGIVGAQGWSWRDKLGLLRVASGWQRAGFVCDPQRSVADLCTALTPRVRAEMIDPLCVSALNTPAAEASGQVFLRVLRDAMFGVSGGSNLLLPRQDLGTLFPDAAATWLGARGGRVMLGQRVQALAPDGSGWRVDGTSFDAVLLACPPTEAARLAAAHGSWCAQARALRFEAITTVYLEGCHRLAEPMLALRASPTAPAQFVFDRGQLGGPAGLWAMVISASDTDRATLEAQVCAQAVTQLACGTPHVLQTVVEKRATFACTPGLQRPPMQIAPGLAACGDYVDGPYPATLEGAVLSGLAAARALR